MDWPRPLVLERVFQFEMERGNRAFHMAFADAIAGPKKPQFHLVRDQLVIRQRTHPLEGSWKSNPTFDIDCDFDGKQTASR